MIRRLTYILLTVLIVPSITAQVSTVTFQPDGNGYDAVLSSASPTSSDGDNELLIASRNSSGKLNRSLMQFDLSTITPGSNIISARLILSGVNHSSANGGGVLQVLPDTWDEQGATWNNSTLLKSATMPTIGISEATSSTENYTLVVTDMVKTMVNSPLINFGWMIHLSDESTMDDEGFEFASSDNSDPGLWPILEITYSDPLIVNAYITPPSTPSSTNGAVYLDISQGAPPYTYSWSSTQTTKDIANIGPGVYTITITDNEGFATSKVIPVASESATTSFTIQVSANTLDNALLVKESFNDNTKYTNFGGSSSISAYNTADASGATLARSLLAIDLNSLPNNATVSSASLVFTDEHDPFETAFNVHLCEVTGDWNKNTVNYDNQPEFDTLSPIIFGYDASETQYALDVSTHFQNMVTQGTTKKGWVIKLEDETANGYGLGVTFGTAVSLSLVIAFPYLEDNQRNWRQEEIYDENGSVILTRKVYLDALGRYTQSMSKNPSNEVFTSQTKYDSYGRPAIETMPAFTGSNLVYQNYFFTDVYGTPYDYPQFDGVALNNPASVQNSVIGTLGNYYSNTNPHDAYQATADNPYTRFEYSGDPSASIRRISKAGNAFKMGSGRENYTFEMASGDELKNVFGANISYKVTRDSADKMECNSISITDPIIANKQIIITPDNKEMISYRVGDKVIATCLASLTNSESCSYEAVNTMSYKGTRCTDIHLPDENKSSMYLYLPVQATIPSTSTTSYTNIIYAISDLYTDVKLTAGTDYSINVSTRNVVFYPAFLNLYTGKSLVLRISFEYLAAYENSLLYGDNPVTPADAKVTYSLNYGRFSKNYYDIGGSLRKSVSPKGFSCSTPTTITMASTYDYNHYGQLIAQKSPDEGLIQATYDNEGKLRFIQNEDQLSNGYFSYVNYDKHARPVELGECHSSSVTANSVWFSNYYNSAIPGYSTAISSNTIINLSDGILNSDKTNTTIACYTIPAGSFTIPAAYTYSSQYQNFRNGEINYVKNVNKTIWFNYDKAGRSKSGITQITEGDFVTKVGGAIDDCIKTSESTYNFFNGIVNTSTYQPNNTGEKMTYNYSYNTNFKPTITTLSYANGAVTENVSSFFYNKMGGLRRVVVGDNYQGIDYVYNLNGSIKAINHPGLDPTLDPGGDIGDYTGTAADINKDLFGEIIEYYNNDYQRSGTDISSAISATSSVYNGLVYATRFKTRAEVNGTNTGANYIDYLGGSQKTLITSTSYSQQELSFKYTYDQFNQLATSSFFQYNNSSNTFTANSEYAETGASGGNIAYDKNGNITRLVRQAYNSIELDNLTYTVGTTHNKLTSILDEAANTYGSDFNFRTTSTVSPGSFTYNSIGQLTASSAESVTLIEYFPNGKVKKITFDNNNTTEYEYGPGGEKLKSKYYNYTANNYKYTWYVGPIIYEFDEAGANSFKIVEAAIPGGVLRINNATITSTAYPVYHITDHLGNVRATFKGSGTGNGIDILSYNDYYAFGGKLPGRIWANETTRYGYQGQEKISDGSNPWCQFDLRMYNQDIGRWFAPDPYQQFASPYIAMANNPVNFVDPNGGKTIWANTSGKLDYGTSPFFYGAIGHTDASESGETKATSYAEFQSGLWGRSGGGSGGGVSGIFGGDAFDGGINLEVDENGNVAVWVENGVTHTETEEEYAHSISNNYGQSIQERGETQYNAFVETMHISMEGVSDISYDALTGKYNIVSTVYDVAPSEWFDGPDGSRQVVGDYNTHTVVTSYGGKESEWSNYNSAQSGAGQPSPGTVAGAVTIVAPSISDIPLIGNSPLAKALSIFSMIDKSLTNAMNEKFTPKGKVRPLTKGEIKMMQNNNVDPHDLKPSQGNGKKIDLFRDTLGDIYYRMEGSKFYNPTFYNWYKIVTP